MRNFFALALVLPLYAFAQGERLPPEGKEQPALDSAARQSLVKDSGTTIVGERESPIGLYITPWRNAFSQQNIDRPPRLLDVDMEPIDRVVFARQVEYHKALSDAARVKTAPVPTAKP